MLVTNIQRNKQTKNNFEAKKTSLKQRLAFTADFIEQNMLQKYRHLFNNQILNLFFF